MRSIVIGSVNSSGTSSGSACAAAAASCADRAAANASSSFSKARSEADSGVLGKAADQSTSCRQHGERAGRQAHRRSD
jgi:hypothetical protein